jgi:DNA-binding NarL/FixJ family response regulator
VTARSTGPAADEIRVLIVEDNFYTRLGAVAFLRRQPGVRVVGQACGGEQALALLGKTRPDVVLVDLRMPGMDGVRLASLLSAGFPRVGILILTHYDGEDDISRALKAGAHGYLTKEASGEELLAAIRAVHGERHFLPPDIARRMSARPLELELTRREHQVLEQVAQGASNREIAHSLGISLRTTEVYVSSILAKLGARSRTEAVAISVRRGLLSAGQL